MVKICQKHGLPVIYKGWRSSKKGGSGGYVNFCSKCLDEEFKNLKKQ
jgi:hypothetical protein